jgi:hypothetical protein
MIDDWFKNDSNAVVGVFFQRQISIIYHTLPLQEKVKTTKKNYFLHLYLIKQHENTEQSRYLPIKQIIIQTTQNKSSFFLLNRGRDLSTNLYY